MALQQNFRRAVLGYALWCTMLPENSGKEVQVFCFLIQQLWDCEILFIFVCNTEQDKLYHLGNMEQEEIFFYIWSPTYRSEEESTPVAEGTNKNHQELFHSEFLLQHHHSLLLAISLQRNRFSICHINRLPPSAKKLFRAWHENLSLTRSW